MFEVSIHWLEFTMPKETPVHETVRELRCYIDAPFTDIGHGALGYENLSVGVGGSKMMTSAKRPEHHITLPGDWCQAVGPEKCCVLLAWVFAHNGHLTRLDLAGDDYSKRIASQGVAIACEKDELVSHCHQVNRTYGIRGKPQDGVYIGSRASRRLLRIYDKDKESEGAIDAIRWELQLRDEAADRAAELVLNTNLPEAYLSVLVGLADFRKVSNDNATRRPRTDWFRKLIGEAQKATLSMPQPVKTIEGIELWLRRQAAPSLAALVIASDGDKDIVETLIQDGKKRLKTTHKIAIEEAKKFRSS